MIVRRLIICSLSCASFLAGSAWAEQMDALTAAKRLADLQDQLSSSDAKQHELATAAEIVAQGEKDIADQLISVAAQIQNKEQILTNLEERAADLDAEDKILKQELSKKKALLAEMLAGLQRLEQNPPPALVVEPHDIISALRGAMMFGAIVPNMKDEANALIAQLQRHKDIGLQLQQAQTEAAETFAELKASRESLAVLLEEKHKLAASLNSELERETAVTVQLGKQATSLQQLLGKIAEQRAKDDALRSAKQAAVEAELARQRAILAKPRVAMAKARGKLEYPVMGRILANFGDNTETGQRFEGVAFVARKEAEVISPVDGTVEFAGPFRSYGQVLILNAGDGYLVLLAGLRRISAVIGQQVQAGEAVGQLGKNAASANLVAGNIGGDRPVLYVEFRKQGKPVDPSDWWVGGRKEAMR